MARPPSKQPNRLTRRTMMTSMAATVGGAVALGGRTSVAAPRARRRPCSEEARQAIQDTADRTIVTGVVEFS